METTKARREATILFCVVFLLGVVFGGLGVHLWNQRVSGQQVVANGRPTPQQLIDAFSRQVQLTPMQRKQLIAIMDDTRAKWQKLYAPLRPQREAIAQDGWKRIREMLTPEQVPKFEAFMRHQSELRRKAEAARAANEH